MEALAVPWEAIMQASNPLTVGVLEVLLVLEEALLIDHRISSKELNLKFMLATWIQT